ncbi:Glycosyltransferase, partial [hydrothermal vent metagenome]
MRIIFLNPQGNFDQKDSHLTEHADFGGQLVYVKEVSMALVEQYPDLKVDIITRRFKGDGWSAEFEKEVSYYPGISNRLRIVRISCGGDSFLRKELLWQHIPEWVDNIIRFYGKHLPDYATAHYGDGGYAAVLLKKKTGISFTFTGHSLGAQKLDKLFKKEPDFNKVDKWYHFSRRIQAERLGLQHADTIITSTEMERYKQYSHPLYRGAVNIEESEKFAVIPPGVNTSLFNRKVDEKDRALFRRIEKESGETKKPAVILSSRLDDKKNHISAVRAYAENKTLQQTASLGIFLRGMKNPYKEVGKLPEKEKIILQSIIDEIDRYHLRDKVFFLDLSSQKELAGAYKYFALKHSVFVLTAFYEPFGLAPIEAGACGLVPVTTKNGGPADIFKNDMGILVDPANTEDIARGISKALENYEEYADKVIRLVEEKYTWQKTAGGYYRVIS